MAGGRMTTSDIQNAINGNISWGEFCLQHKDEYRVFKARNDGVVTSNDFKMKFDSSSNFVSYLKIKPLFEEFLKNEVEEEQINFIANAILLSNADFESEDLEDLFHILANIETKDEMIELINQFKF